MRISLKSLACALAALTMLLLGPVPAAQAKCVWDGKAPLCNGKCKTGFKYIRSDKSGDGDACVTGSKAFCCPDQMVITRGKAPACNGECKPGETRVGDSDTGENGQRCITGKAAQCINPVK